MDWTAIAQVSIPTVGVLVGGWATLREGSTKRDIEATRQFSEMLTIASGRRRDTQNEPDLAEQLAHIELVATLGRRHRAFREAATSALEVLAHASLREVLERHTRLEPNSKDRVRAAAQAALSRLGQPRWWRVRGKAKSRRAAEGDREH